MKIIEMVKNGCEKTVDFYDKNEDSFIMAVKWSIIVILLCFGYRYLNWTRHVSWVKEHSDTAITQLGFEKVGYEGYQYHPIGGQVWYTMKRVPDNGIIYHAGCIRWFDEVHVYNLEAIDAIKPQ